MNYLEKNIVNLKLNHVIGEDNDLQYFFSKKIIKEINSLNLFE